MANTSPDRRNIDVTQQQNPDWVNQAGEDIYGNATDLINQPYQQYKEPRIADFTKYEDQAHQQIVNEQGAFTPELTKAQGMFDTGAKSYAQANGALPTADRMGPIADVNAQQIDPITGVKARDVSTGSWDQNAYNQYMTPFTSSVLNPTLDEIRRQNGMTQRDLGAKAATVGALGSQREGVAQSENTGRMANAMDQTIGNLNYQGYTNAQSMFGTDQGRKLSADQGNQNSTLSADQGNQRTDLSRLQSNQSTDLSAKQGNQNTAFNVGAANQKASMFDVGNKLSQFNTDQDRALTAGNDMSQFVTNTQNVYDKATDRLGAVGAEQRNMDQRSLDLAHDDFTAQQNDPYDKLNFVSGILNKTPYNKTQVQDTVGNAQGKGPSTASQVVGAGASIASMFM